MRKHLPELENSDSGKSGADQDSTSKRLVFNQSKQTQGIKPTKGGNSNSNMYVLIQSLFFQSCIKQLILREQTACWQFKGAFKYNS